MQRRLKTDWNWHRRKAGESFFVPTLRPHEMMIEGLRYAHKFFGYPAPVKARVGIHAGLLGVMFTVRPVRSR